MNRTLSLADRLALVGNGRRVTKAELADLAEYSGEVASWASELEAKFADFAANAEMLADPSTPRNERNELRERMTADAEAASGALKAIGLWC